MIYHQGFDLASESHQVRCPSHLILTECIFMGWKAGTKLEIPAIGCQCSGSLALTNNSIVHTLLVWLQCVIMQSPQMSTASAGAHDARLWRDFLGQNTQRTLFLTIYRVLPASHNLQRLRLSQAVTR